MRVRFTTPLLAVLLLAFALAFQGTRPLWEPDEGRYSAVALRMIDDSDPIVPRLNAETEHWTKPPVTYWALAASAALFGRNEWALRLPNALAFVATALLVGAIARRLFSPREGGPRKLATPAFATIVYATMLLPATAANVITTDTLLTLFETLAILAFVAGWRERDARSAGFRFDLMWIAFGAAFLTKGPPGLLPLLAIVAAVRFLPRAARPKLFRPAGMILGAIVALSWFAIAIARRPDLLDAFVGREIVERVATDAHDRNGEWYGALVVYGPALLLGGLPWLPLALRSPATWGPRLRAALGREGRAADPARFYLALATLVPLAVFVAARSRLPFYVLPLFVPIALSVANSLEARGSRAWFLSARVPLAVWIAALVGARGLAAAVETPKDDRDLAAVISAAAPETREIVFVGSSPHWGLSAYIPTEVFRREIPAPSARALPPGTLYLEERELDRDGAAFLVPLRHVAEFEAFAAGAGRTFRHRATVHDLNLYVSRDPGDLPGGPSYERNGR